MEINEARNRMNEVDDQMLELFLRRMELSEEIAAYKQQNSLPILNRQREREILADVMAKSGELGNYSYELFTTLIELSKARQSELYSAPTRVRNIVESGLASAGDFFPRRGLVACQGIEGGNSQEACDKLLPQGTIIYVKTFDAVLDAVESGLCEYGVLPIENSSNGSVRSVYELLLNREFSIVRGTSLCIRHELMAKPGVKLSEIREIYSHEQAVGQCRRYLSTLGGVKVIPCGNTAVAAKMVSESSDRSVAAISSHRCAELYGLEVINDDVQDSDNNYTRFICVTKKPRIYSGANRISLIVACGNTPGALGAILGKFAAHGVNMCKLESCPVTGRNFEFIFFIDIEASVQEPGILPMLEELERCCAGFTFLGNYTSI